MTHITRYFLFVFITLTIAGVVNAQVENEELDDNLTEQTDNTEGNQEQQALLQLREIQVSINNKIAARRDLQEQIVDGGADAPESLHDDLTELNAEIETLNNTFEQIAIGGIDLSVFGIESEAFDWREELITIVKPLIENIKGLTEKPRKIESLRRVIADNSTAKEAAIKALESIQTLKQDATEESIVEKLTAVESEWNDRLQDLERAIQLADYQLENLEGNDVSWGEVIKQGFFDFINGRGLTLLIVLIAITAVWFTMRGILWLSRKQSKESHDRTAKVRYRLAAYGYRLLTGIFIAIAIMVVLYSRQDLLLLAIMVVVIIGLALALKNLLPQYIAEGRILLNVGAVRERERVIYNGIPWEITAVNMFSIFTNPEIRGILRIPISEMHEMISRPTTRSDIWFPSSEGDWVLNDDGNPVQVISQTVDVVEIEDRNALRHIMPTAEYFDAGFRNLSRAAIFRISIVFGIDYATQTYNIDDIEKAFSDGIRRAFEGTPFAEFLASTNVDFHSAGDSSLNYQMMARVRSEAAPHHNQIKRRMQRASVMVCNENGWGIPFPQMSVHLSTEDNDEQEEVSKIDNSIE